MRNKRIHVGLLLFGVAILVGVGVVGSFVRPPLEPDQIVPARFGDVAWNHELHARMKEIQNCQVCHHKERLGTSKPRPCRKCHKPESNQNALVVAELHMKVETKKYEGENGPPPMTAFHGRCIGCHRAMKEGPVVCRDCHAQSFSGPHGVVRWDHLAHARRIEMPVEGGADAACKYCHHQDKKAETVADYRPCRACHKPATVMKLEVATGIKKHEKLLHNDCRRCHTLFNPEEDKRTCTDCHQKWKVDYKTTKVRPSVEQAVHKRCMVCHQKDYAELEAGMPVRCDDCHVPDPSVLTDLDVGLILWDHNRHAKYGEGMTCAKCHHTDLPDQPHMVCSRCHGTGLYKNPPVAEALRKRCIGCHKEKKNGLVSWDHINTDRKQVRLYKIDAKEGPIWWDHREHAVTWSFSCRNCHHALLLKDGTYVTGAKAKVSWTGNATHVQTCRNCHGEKGPKVGSPAAKTKAPKLDDAFKKICIECHRKLGGGPQEWADYYKVEVVEETADASTPDIRGSEQGGDQELGQ